MTLEAYIHHLQNIVKYSPESKNKDVKYFSDEEGNSLNKVIYPPRYDKANNIITVN